MNDTPRKVSSYESSPAEPQHAFAELRLRSGMTFEEIAGLFGVTRRTVHFWVSGRALQPDDERRLGDILHAIRYIDRGSASATRDALRSVQEDGATPFDLLSQGRFDDAMRCLGKGRGRRIIVTEPLSPEAAALRRPPPPERLVGALQDPAHRNLPDGRAVRAAWSKEERSLDPNEPDHR